MMLKKTAAFAFAVLLASAIGIPALASSLTDAEIQTLLQERIDQNRMGVGIVVGLWLLLQKTTLGRALRACAENPAAARLMGIDLRAMMLLSFGLAAMIRSE